MCMSGPSAPALPPPPPPPPMPATPVNRNTPQAKQARDDERSRIRQMAGAESTIRTSSQGVLADADKQTKKLLGG